MQMDGYNDDMDVDPTAATLWIGQSTRRTGGGSMSPRAGFKKGVA
jgi:hypothetical protein